MHIDIRLLRICEFVYEIKNYYPCIYNYSMQRNSTGQCLLGSRGILDTSWRPPNKKPPLKKF